MSTRIACSLVMCTVLALLQPDPARAQCVATPGVPCAANSILPCGMNLVGASAAAPVADPAGIFSVTVFDGTAGGGAAIIGADVWLDFTACCNDVRLSSSQFGPGMVLLPALKQVHGTSGPGGLVTFRIMGAASNLAATPGAGCAAVWATNAGSTVLLSDGISWPPALQVGAYDLNGALAGGAGLSAADLALLLNDFFNTPPYRARDDYDYNVLCAQNVGPPDIARWLSVFFAAGSTTNGPGFVVCP